MRLFVAENAGTQFKFAYLPQQSFDVIKETIREFADKNKKEKE